ncbi:MAG: hypothetical protein H7Y88_01365 [Phycisphaerales bacterium]|nr:hypothetical protein [Phycisphaerales bacterium]
MIGASFGWAGLSGAGPEDGKRPAPKAGEASGGTVGAVGNTGSGGVFLANDKVRPHVTISWPRRDGTIAMFEGHYGYTEPEGRKAIGGNLEAFVTIGGSRLDFGAADPAGAIVRVGFYKADKSKLLFEDLKDDGAVTITLTGVRFNRSATGTDESVIHHIKFDDPSSLIGCVTPADSPDIINTYNTASAEDDLRGKLTAKNSRRGTLASAPAAARVEAAADGSVALRATLPYVLFKHVEDPWLRTAPGTFAEPFHFHVEFQALPRGEEVGGVKNGARGGGGGSDH